MQFIAANQCRAMEVAIAAEWKKNIPSMVQMACPEEDCRVFGDKIHTK